MFVTTVLLYNLSHLRSAVPPPHFIDQFLGLLEKLIPCMRVDTSDKLTEVQMNEEAASVGASSVGKRYYATLACALKYLVFIFFFAIYLLVIFSCFAI